VTDKSGLAMRYEDILEKLNETLEYCETIGLSGRVQQSRFIEYKKIIKRLCDVISSYSIDALPPEVETELRDRTLEHVISLTDSIEFTGVLPYLKTCSENIVRNKIRKVLSGPLLPKDEDQNSNEARNTLFELSLASKLSAAGLKASLGLGADVECEISGKQVLIECKRPFSGSAINKRIREARKQVESNLKNTRPGSRGVIAVSLSKIMNPTDKFFAFLEESSAKDKLADLLEIEAEKSRNTLTELGNKIIGIIFHVITPCANRKDAKFSVGQQFNAHPLAADGSADYAAFRSLYDSLAKVSL